jgi:long-chain acyl-CoA synthetase
MFLGVSAMLRRTVQTRPHDLATVFGSRRQTWTELLARTQRLAGGLRKLGLTKGERIALVMNNCDRYVETALASAWAGGVVTPLNGRWSVLELNDAVEDSTPLLLMVDDANLKAGLELIELAKKANRRLTLIYSGDGECPKGVESYVTLAEKSAPVEDAGCMGDDLFTIFYTKAWRKATSARTPLTSTCSPPSICRACGRIWPAFARARPASACPVSCRKMCSRPPPAKKLPKCF